MKIEGKNLILKLLIVCLALISAQKADDFLYPSDRDGFPSIQNDSEIRKPETGLIRTENSVFSMPESQCRIPRQTNFTNSLRTSGHAQRQNNAGQLRTGYTLVKSGKSMNEYTTSLFFRSILDFPSGMNESNHHLISLRKLII